MNSQTVRILLVEDSPSDADVLQETMRGTGASSFEFTWVQRLTDVVAHLRGQSFDVLLLDLSLPDSTGLDTFRRARSAAPGLPIVVLTGIDDEPTGLAALREGVQDYLIKGQANGRQIARAIRYAVERNRTEERTRRQNAVLAGIGRIFREALTCATEEDLGRACLAVAEEVTQSQFGFVGQIDPKTRLLDDIAISDPGWEACRMSRKPGHGKLTPAGFKIHGIYGRVLLDGKGFFTNDPTSHRDHIPTPPGHPPLRAFLGVPLIHGDRTMGMIALGNRPGGYGPEDLEAMEALAPAVVQAFLSKRAEEALRAAMVAAEQARGVAEQASRAKDQFIAVLSHELRTPLTPALAAVSALADDARLPADVREDLAMVHRNIDLEVDLIHDLLDVSRIISGKLRMEKHPVDVAETIRQAAGIVAGELEAKGQILTIETPGAPYPMLADAARLQQVFWNLLRNATKFTPEHGRIMVNAELQAASAHLSVLITVKDTGIGILPDMLPRLFNAFEQGREARNFGGLGLGLSICKAVVEMHRGTITAQSEGRGKGATFTIRLPLSQSRPHAQKPQEQSTVPPPTAPQRLRILLVEDHADTARLMVRLLRRAGHEVTSAGSVAEGLAAVQQGNPDVLISDVGLPDGSGMDLMRQLLKQGRRLPAIALSGYGAPADIERSKAAGFVDHLVKPLSGIDALVAALRKACAQNDEHP